MQLLSSLPTAITHLVIFFFFFFFFKAFIWSLLLLAFHKIPSEHHLHATPAFRRSVPLPLLSLNLHHPQSVSQNHPPPAVSTSPSSLPEACEYSWSGSIINSPAVPPFETPRSYPPTQSAQQLTVVDCCTVQGVTGFK